MSHPNNPIVYNEWSKLKEENTNFAEKLEQLNRVRESIFSQSGWSSKNVNQSSKWLVDLENDQTSHKLNSEMGTNGTNVWCTNLTQEAENPCSIVPDSAVFNFEHVNCPTECQCTVSSSHMHQFDASAIHEYRRDSHSTDKKADDSHLTLHLQLQTLNINVDDSRVHRRNSTNNFCQIPNNQPQIDLMLN